MGLLALAVLWGVAFTNGVYGQRHTRLAAADWITAEAPDGAVLSFQEWDDGLPFSSPAAQAKRFGSEKLSPFALVTPDDVRRFAASLDRIDYVVETSDRVYAPVVRVPARFGPTIRYYQGLEDGSLGFEPVASFTNEPSLLGVHLADGGSEESFRVYDHPPVRIWRKTSAFSLEGALAVLQPDRAATVEQVPLASAGANGLLQRADVDRPGTGPTFDQAFPDRLPAPWLWWFGWWELTALAALPWVTRLFGALPDRGVGVAKVLGPLAVVVPLWFAIALGVVPFTTASAWAATVLAVGVGVAVPRWRRDAIGLWRTHRRAIVAVELATLATFAAVLLLRSSIPDLWFHPTGGEKPFNAAYFTSVARSRTFPPADPWFSGGTMNYYYGGWFSMAVPTRLLGIPPDVALNLLVATAASLAVAVAWSIGSALAGLRRAVASRGSVLGGLFAAVALLGVGNLASTRQQVQRVSDARAGKVAPTFDWWGVSRLHAGTTDINEFPAWTVLFGDPHPHLIALPVLLGLVATLGTYVISRQQGRTGAAGGLAVVAGLGVAWTRIGHTWDLPTVILLSVVAVLAGTALDRGDGWRPWRLGAAHLVGLGVVALVVSTPYSQATQVFDSGFAAAPTHTPFGSFLLQLGLPLAITGLFLGRRLVGAVRRRSLPVLLGTPWGWAGVAALATGVEVLVLLAAGPVVGLAALVVAGCLASAVVDLRHGDLGRGVAAGIVAAGVGLAALPDVVVVVNDLSRMNTVFKFGFTAWALLAVGAAVLAADLVAGARRQAPWAALVLVLALPGLLFWPSATPRRVEARFASLPRTLDGRDWLDHGPVEVGVGFDEPFDVTADNGLIDWIRANVREGSTIVEAAGNSYSWVARVSVATGLPTVIGWQFHQVQQRRGYGPKVDERANAVKAFYADPDPEQALRFLAGYRPDYVVVGTVEHAVGTPEALAALPVLPGLRLRWQDGDEAVYRVDHVAIDAALATIDAERIRTAPTDPPITDG